MMSFKLSFIEMLAKINSLSIGSNCLRFSFTATHLIHDKVNIFFLHISSLRINVQEFLKKTLIIG